MSYPENDDLKRACNLLRIRDVWAVAYSDGVVLTPPPDRDGLTESPFREDGKRGSFSICYDGHGFKDFGGNGLKGGTWKFHELCWPSLDKGDRAKALIELATRHGFVPTAAPVRSAGAGGSQSGAAVEIDPRLEKAAKALDRRDRAREQERLAWEKAESGLHAPAPKAVPAMPPFALDHYQEGVTHMKDQVKRTAQLAEERGWPVAWAEGLVKAGLVSYPWERWARVGQRWAARQKAFLVQAPRLASMGRVKLEAVGYHQRFYEPATDGRPEHKGWLYVPSIPQKGARSTLEEQLMDYGRSLGLEWDERKRAPALVPPLPFVLGELSVDPKLIVLLEGQWDAATFYGACGWFYDDETAEEPPLSGVMVFGIRGAQGMEAFLSHWGPWLRAWKARAWVIADNDAAGGTWRDAPTAAPGMPRPPSLADKLVAAGCRDPLVSWLKRNPARPADKDFNDFYRAARPTVEQMKKWMRAVGVLSGTNQWI